MKRQRKKKHEVDCNECKVQPRCCRLGAWVDLGEAKKILKLGIKGGDFFHLEKDDDYPSGYRVGTSVEDDPCSFLTRAGLCAIHKIDYRLKPEHCKEFPYEKGKLSPIAQYLCESVRSRRKKKRGKAKKGFMLVELLVAMAIIIFVVYAVLKLHSNQPVLNKETQEVIKEAGIDTTNYRTTIESAKEKLEEIQSKHFEDLEKAGQ